MDKYEVTAEHRSGQPISFAGWGRDLVWLQDIYSALSRSEHFTHVVLRRETHEVLQQT